MSRLRFVKASAYGLWLLTAACSTRPVLLPGEVTAQKAVIKLESEGQIRIRQRVKGSGLNCERLKKALKLEIHRFWMGQVEAGAYCVEGGKTLLFVSRPTLPSGDYALRWPTRHSMPSLAPAQMAVKYKNPDFARGSDHQRSGAALWPAGKPLHSSVNYHVGDRTDWIQVAGENSSTLLTFRAQPGGMAWAEVFQGPPQGSIRTLGSLSHGKPRRFALGKSDLWIRVRSSEMGPRVEYQLTRQESEARKPAHVRVLDCYPVGGGEAIALLRVSEGVAVHDSVLISASDASGRRSTLGKCTVLNVDGAEASCRLPYLKPAEWTRFQAEAVFPAGEKA